MQIPWLFPDFSQYSFFSLTFNKIPWLFPDFCQVWNFPDFSLTAGHPAETQMKKGEQISIKGYRWVHRPRPNNKGGGVGILVTEKLARNTTEDNSSEAPEHLETKWIKLECRPKI